MWSLINSILSGKAHHVKIIEQAVHFRRNKSSDAGVLSHVSYDGHGSVPKRYPRWTIEMDGIHWHSGPEKLLITLTGKNGENRCRMIHPKPPPLVVLIQGSIVKFPKPASLFFKVVPAFYGP